MTRRLVVTGDDFGASAEVNAGIARAFDEGVLTSASILVTGEALGEAVAMARARPAMATGLHLALCDAAPASVPEAIPGLVGPDGRFPPDPGPTGIAHWLRRRERRPQLEREIRAQVERYLDTGLPLDHVDGHHHLHMHPIVFDVLLRCIEDYKIPWVRLVNEDGRARRGGEPVLGEVVVVFFRMLARRHRGLLARRGGAGAPDRVYGLRATGRLDLAEWLRLIDGLREASVEIYSHPETATEAGRRQLDALRAPELRAAIEAAGYRLASTREMAGAA